MTRVEALTSMAQTLVRFRKPPEQEASRAIERAVSEIGSMFNVTAGEGLVAIEELRRRYGIA